VSWSRLLVARISGNIYELLNGLLLFALEVLYSVPLIQILPYRPLLSGCDTANKLVNDFSHSLTNYFRSYTFSRMQYWRTSDYYLFNSHKKGYYYRFTVPYVVRLFFGDYWDTRRFLKYNPPPPHH
jgi:hypothetical protein